MCLLKAHTKLITTVIKPYRLLLWGVAVSLTLPLFGCISQTKVVHEKPSAVTNKFDKNGDGIIDRADWRRMTDSDKKTYVRMSLEEIGENPDTTVSQGKTREDLLLEGLEAIYK